MNEQIQQKILELKANGTTDYRLIQDELRKPEIITTTNSRPRIVYAEELELYNLVVPSIATVEELQGMSGEEMESYCQHKLMAMFDLAPTNEVRTLVTALSLQIDFAHRRVIAKGSRAFADANFLQQTETYVSETQGQCWLEKNGFGLDDVPPKYEILELVWG